MNWKPAVITDNSGKWAYNALVFATKEEAQASADEVSTRWTLVIKTDAHETEEPVNCHFDFEKGRNVHHAQASDVA